MKILAVDTSTQGCSVAVSDNDTLVAEFNLVKKETHSKHLMSLIDTLLKTSGIELPDIDGFAVTIGPGSFTGLRIGLSTIKGLAYVASKPVVGVSSLETLAFAVPFDECNIVSMIDARKGEVYAAGYRMINGMLETEFAEKALTPEELMGSVNEKTVFLGTGAIVYGDLISDMAGDYKIALPDNYHYISAGSVAKLSLRKFDHETLNGISSLVPHYIRKSDAEINLNKKAVKEA